MASPSWRAALAGRTAFVTGGGWRGGVRVSRHAGRRTRSSRCPQGWSSTAASIRAESASEDARTPVVPCPGQDMRAAGELRWHRACYWVGPAGAPGRGPVRRLVRGGGRARPVSRGDGGLWRARLLHFFRHIPARQGVLVEVSGVLAMRPAVQTGFRHMPGGFAQCSGAQHCGSGGPALQAWANQGGGVCAAPADYAGMCGHRRRRRSCSGARSAPGRLEKHRD